VELRSLSLVCADYSACSYSLLTRLTNLQRLHLAHCTALPACLPKLTTLQALVGECASVGGWVVGEWVSERAAGVECVASLAWFMPSAVC